MREFLVEKGEVDICWSEAVVTGVVDGFVDISCQV